MATTPYSPNGPAETAAAAGAAGGSPSPPAVDVILPVNPRRQFVMKLGPCTRHGTTVTRQYSKIYLVQYRAMTRPHGMLI